MTTDEKIKKELFSLEAKQYGAKYEEHLLEEYKLYVEMMDRVSTRRDSANTFFMTINSALIAVMGIFTGIAEYPSNIKIGWFIVSSLVGILLCRRWINIIQSYSDLNTGKFKIIHLLEDKLPAKLYKAEWDFLYPPNEKPKYKPLTEVEKNIPRIFIGLYIVLIIIAAIYVSYNPFILKLIER